jgi:hypothetical protein
MSFSATGNAFAYASEARPSSPVLPYLHPCLRKTPFRCYGNKHADWPHIRGHIRLGENGRFFEHLGGAFATMFNLLAQERRAIEVYVAEADPPRRLMLERMRDDSEGLIASLITYRDEGLFKALRYLLRNANWTGENPNTYAAWSLYTLKNAIFPVMRGGGEWRLPAPAGCLLLPRALRPDSILQPSFAERESLR